MARLLHSSTDTSFFLHKIEIPLSYSALYLRLTGTADATGVNTEDVGRISYTIRNQQMVDAEFQVLQHLSNVLAGTPAAVNDGVVSVAYEFSCIIPRFWLDDNVEFVTKEDNAIFRINFGGNIASHTASGFLCELYAVLDEGLNSYNLRIIQTEDSIGSGTFSQDLTSVENIAAVYLTDIVSGDYTLASSNISRVVYSIGDKQGNMSVGAGLDLTRLKNQIESAAYTEMLEIYASEIGDINSRLDDAINVQLTSGGSATPQFLQIGLQFNPNKIVETAARLDNRFTQLLNSKTAAGKTRSVTAIRQLAAIGS